METPASSQGIFMLARVMRGFEVKESQMNINGRYDWQHLKPVVLEEKHPALSKRLMAGGTVVDPTREWGNSQLRPL